MASVTDLYSSLEVQRVRDSVSVTEREREREREREKTSKTRAHYAGEILEERYVSVPIETKYLKFWLLIILGSGGI